ncbi:RNA polymerase sigma factor FliA [Pseudomonas lijiangensis]|uniref:RNA polymerase sigma factor n=1 Tax=Pseudomonas lijiangensis TaxID=2995658 RepID=A0ABX8HRI7_9PSED|nr:MULTISPECIES: RNA polymerase sigma factor FliA [Pseudomonas syringae group]MBX8501103.1 RNA polymerase sigma factor FliA [Pseudomonas lijiangensis]MBX8505937.1 RNA polymerase sigma factor FliA [Pseudomonas lijiangensis]MBX8520675.1 RNA polymerase sigma factor FliA [Pseudomonas cichorii]MBX8534188.1 RNA polymerase sigma factor FliA [Pseudomonas cichorii]MBX8554070.1 RNA polymerase sigma factor FliA [Pseudomonas cichorii]
MYTAQGKMNQQELLKQYLPLVRRQALGLKTRLPANIELDDLIQAGSIGLLDAMTRYDVDIGATFGTFASQRIRGAMIDELRTRDWVPRSVRRNARALEDAIHRLEQSLGRPAKEREIAAAMGLSLDEYHQVLSDTNGSQMLPIDDLGEDHSEALSSKHITPFAELVNDRNRIHLIRAIDAVPERERVLLALCYQEKLNLREIGMVLGVSESRACQLHSQAIARLRTSMAE